MPQTSFPIQNFVLGNGDYVIDGYLLIHINKDATPSTAGSGGQIGAKVKIEVSLGALGEVLDDPQFWENTSLTPSDTVYIMEVFNSNGLRIAGPMPVTVGPFTGTLGFGSAFGASFGS